MKTITLYLGKKYWIFWLAVVLLSCILLFAVIEEFLVMIYLYLFFLFPLLFYAFSKGIGKITLKEDAILLHTLFGFRRARIALKELKGFEFMRDYYFSVPKGKGRYLGISGPTVIIFHYNSGRRRAYSLFGFRQIMVVLTYLLSNHIPFLNHKPTDPLDKRVEGAIYQKSGLRVFMTVIFPIFLLLVVTAVSACLLMSEYNQKFSHLFLCILPFLLYLFYSYWERMYYLVLNDQSFIIKNLMGRRSREFKYSDMMKTSFGSSLGKGTFLYLEMLDKNYKYYQFPLDMLPRKQVKEIVKIFREKGIDATNECC